MPMSPPANAAVFESSRKPLFCFCEPWHEKQRDSRIGRISVAKSTALIARAYRLAFGRPPTRIESESAVAVVESGVKDYAAAGLPDARSLALVDFCQALLGLNEFIYVD